MNLRQTKKKAAATKTTKAKKQQKTIKKLQRLEKESAIVRSVEEKGGKGKNTN